MNRLVLAVVVVLALIAGCASADRHSVVDLNDGSSVHTLHCRDEVFDRTVTIRCKQD